MNQNPTKNSDAQSTITIRSARPEDGEKIVEFNAAIAKETESIELDADRLKRGVWAILLDPTKGKYYVAEKERQIVGQMLITYEWSDWRDGVNWWFQSIYVSPEHRRNGILRAIFDYVLAEAKNRPEVCGVRLYVEHNNTVARQAYESLGLTHSHYELYQIDYVLDEKGDNRDKPIMHCPQ
jgi:ribosomal protein S18 acetylase RimI-like enzyme